MAYAARGWRVAPIPAGLQHPGRDDWQNAATTDATTIRRWYTVLGAWRRTRDGFDDLDAYGVCIVTGRQSGLFVVDVDHHGDINGQDTLDDLDATYGPLPDTVEAITGRGGRHLYYRYPDGLEIRNSAGNVLGPGLDVRGEGGQVIAPPSISAKSGDAYQWEAMSDPLEGIAVADAPQWLVQLLTAVPVARTPRRTLNGAQRPIGDLAPGERFEAEHDWADLLTADGWQLFDARNTARGGDGYELWTRPGKERREGASASLYYGGSDVLKVFTSNAAGLDQDATYTRFGYWAATRYHGDHSAAAQDLRAEHQRRQGNGTVTTEQPPVSATVHEIEDQDEEPTPGDQPYTDLGNARRLVAAHGHDLRYAPELGTWLIWDGTRWAEDVTLEVNRRQKAVVDAMFTQLATVIGQERRKRLFSHWQRSQAAARLSAAVDVARSEPEVPVLVRQLDSDPWALNTLTGLIDLRTGALSGHERRALVTKLAPVHVEPDAACPTWEWFVDWAMGGDPELVGFLQRAIGYSLTGTVGEQVLFFCHGDGENGKSTFLNVITALLGDYTWSADSDLLLATEHSQHSTRLLDLAGRRFVVAQEVDEGRKIAEAMVKKLTSSEPISAHRMRQDNVEFTPTHKLWMAANHKPGVRGTDHAIWRRIRLIPFHARIAPGERDEHLPDRLNAELPGILQWALRGCAEWQRVGLQPPAAVAEATSSYRAEQDHVGRFLTDCCEIDERATITARDLRTAYEAWCAEQGEHAWSAKAMGSHLTERGYERVKEGRANLYVWHGISLGGVVGQPLNTPFDWQSAAAGDREARTIEQSADHCNSVTSTADHADRTHISPPARHEISATYGERSARSERSATVDEILKDTY